MKKVVIVMMLLAGVTAIAQKGDRNNRKHLRDLSPEQTATLQTKKATLALDLSEAQQTQIKALFVENANKRAEHKAQRESGETKALTSKEKYERTNARLDHQIAQKAKLKEILSDEQFEKWAEIQKRRGHRGKKKGYHKSKN